MHNFMKGSNEMAKKNVTPKPKQTPSKPGKQPSMTQAVKKLVKAINKGPGGH